jgi:hypothetical protein
VIPQLPTPPEPTPDEPTGPTLLEAHRTSRFEELGFSYLDAGILAGTRGGDGFPLYWGQAKKLLDAGCDHATVMRIYA